MKPTQKSLILFTMIFIAGSAFSQKMSLQACIELAMQNNAELKQNDFSLGQADLNVKNSVSNLMPGISASASANSQGPGFLEG